MVFGEGWRVGINGVFLTVLAESLSSLNVFAVHKTENDLIHLSTHQSKEQRYIPFKNTLLPIDDEKTTASSVI